MCSVLDVSKAGYYAWRGREKSARAKADEELTFAMRVVHRESRETYGSPRMYREMRKGGTRCSENRVARLTRRAGLKAKKRRRFRVTTTSWHRHPVAPNVLERRFRVADVSGRNQIWVGDITYVPTREGWLYLAVILDLHSRRVVGWAMRSTLAEELALAALRMAVRARKPGTGVLHYTDRGSQYAGKAYRALLTELKMTCSMSRKGDCWDNAVAGSFFATLEWELIDGANWSTRDQARSAILEYIETWYNRRRLHSSLGYLSPDEFETLDPAA
jgi:transposase InsO family protein